MPAGRLDDALAGQPVEDGGAAGPVVHPVDVPDVAQGSEGAAIALSVAGAARGLGVAPGTLRSWERRYGLTPSMHTSGGHRRYGPEDLARLGVMHRLVQEGVPPAEAARAAIRAQINPHALEAASPYALLLDSPGLDRGPDQAPASPDPEPEVDAAGSAGGGRVLSVPSQPRSVRGLARAAMALDSVACHRTLATSLSERGVIATWEELARPVLVAMGERWSRTRRGVEIEHSFSRVLMDVVAAHGESFDRPVNGRPALLASVPDELHDLPLMILQAALSEVGIRSHVTGARTPVDALRDAVVRLGPPVVFLWAQMPEPVLPELPPVRPGPTLIVGGPGWVEVPDGAQHVSDLGGAVGAVRAAMGL